jgi:ATP-binding cassette subfamily B (MDR/TAP) protein 6
MGQITIDIVIACFYLTAQFDMIFGKCPKRLIKGGLVFLTMFFYLAATILLTEWRIKYKKRANELDNDMEAKAVDSLLNYETVKYYCAEEFEVCRYEDGEAI